MTYLKVLGIAVIAAAGFMTFVGAGSASATVLCTTTDTPKCTMPYLEGETLHLTLKSGTSMKLTSGGSTIATCSESAMHGTLEAWTGDPTYQNILNTSGSGGLSWGGCSQTTHTVNSGTLDIDWISGTHNGTVTGTLAEWTTNIFGVSCTYGFAEAGTHLGTLTGGAEPILTIATTVVKKAGGFLCPATAGLDAEYVVTAPHAVFVTTE